MTPGVVEDHHLLLAHGHTGRHGLAADQERAGQPVGDLLHRVVVGVVHADGRRRLHGPLVGEVRRLA